MDQPHIYEDPDSMPPLSRDITLVPRDYRESPVTSSMSSGTRSGVSQQKLGKESSSKPTKKWNLRLRGKKPKNSGESSTKKQGKITEKKSSGAHLKKTQVKTSDFQSSLQKGWNSADTAENFYDEDDDSSPPPLLPTRGYLMDEEFTVELNALEKQFADADVDTESEENDDYVPMGSNVQESAEEDEVPDIPKRDYALSNADLGKPHLPPRQKGAPVILARSCANNKESLKLKKHYMDSNSPKPHPQIPQHHVASSLPPRSYQNIGTQDFSLPMAVPTRPHRQTDSVGNIGLPPRRHVESQSISITSANIPERTPAASHNMAEKCPPLPKRIKPPTPESLYENFTDEPSCSSEAHYVNESCNEGLYVNKPDIGRLEVDDQYINADDEGQYMVERDQSLYVNQATGTVISRQKRSISKGQDSESEGEYEYVQSDAVRCMRRMMARKTGRRTK